MRKRGKRMMMVTPDEEERKAGVPTFEELMVLYTIILSVSPSVSPSVTPSITPSVIHCDQAPVHPTTRMTGN